MKVNICVPGEQCTGFWMKISKYENAGISFGTRRMPNPNSWRRDRTNCGVGIHLHLRAGASVTKLLGPTKWTYYYLYNILDVYSRYSVGWLIAERETATLAEELIVASCVRQGIQPGQLTVHADRGGPMIAKSVAQLLADLGVTKTHSRPHVSNDNPFSESQFTPALAGGARETLKYRPDYPGRFGCPPDARGWAAEFFDWYNYEHHHSALGLLTPADVHFGRAPAVLQQRQQVLAAAYDRTPQRFVKGLPQPLALPAAVWINPPAKQPQDVLEIRA
jgi:putative transposase